jgi:hypothetical protein
LGIALGGGLQWFRLTSAQSPVGLRLMDQAVYVPQYHMKPDIPKN